MALSLGQVGQPECVELGSTVGREVPGAERQRHEGGTGGAGASFEGIQNVAPSGGTSAGAG
jgi:hypothetical protein